MSRRVLLPVFLAGALTFGRRHSLRERRPRELKPEPRPGGPRPRPRRGARVRHGLINFEGTGRYDGPITHRKLEADPEPASDSFAPLRSAGPDTPGPAHFLVFFEASSSRS